MTHKVFIRRLKLNDFRNYAGLSLTLDERHVVLTGENGAGKTNLMEAVSFLSPGRGLRRAVLADVARVGATGGFSIFSEIEGMEGDVEIGTGTESDEETVVRRLRINGTTAKSVDELTDHLRVLWLTPSMDGLFTGPSSDRRRFLDRLVLSLDPAHGRRASDFERAMRSRNKLSRLRVGSIRAWLTGIEQQMAGLGVAMMHGAPRDARPACEVFTDPGVGRFGSFPSALAGPQRLSSIVMNMRSLRPSRSRTGMPRSLALANGRYRDAAAGRTLEGPHRADLLVRHADKDIEAERCSTGEQKALLVGLDACPCKSRRHHDRVTLPYSCLMRSPRISTRAGAQHFSTGSTRLAARPS